MGSTQRFYLGLNPITQKNAHVRGDFVFQDDDLYYKIENVQEMDEFFITLVSDADHWMFISSKGALTAGRINPDHALFPYDTVDRVYAYKNRTGVKTALWVTKKDKTFIWEPWSDISEKIYEITRNIYKNTTGCELIFEEINNTLDLAISYSWSLSRNYGFIKKTRLTNLLKHPVSLSLADGFSNMISPGITRQILTTFSCLTDAYKYNVVHPCGLAAYNLASRITDKAEPKESLRATICWNAGLNNTQIFLSSKAFHSFCNGKKSVNSSSLKGRQNDYFVATHFLLSGEETKSWYLIADVFMSQVRVEDLIDNVISSPQVIQSIEKERKNTRDNLQKIIARADGFQLTEDKRFCSHHYANTLFNVMRGGIIYGDKINLHNFLSYLKIRNTLIYKKYIGALSRLDPEISREDLLDLIAKEKDPSLKRHILEYLPLRFSRRHGDPSRPWNNFSINIEDKDGRPVLNYEGNWRDIFQNWEALGLSFPFYYKHFIAKFLNAITMEGYNPYRITQNGFEWEKIEPGNPWSNIGYWKDHQIIYLQKFFEWQEIFFPGSLIRDMTEEIYSYAHIPYRIRAYEKILENPRETIDFDDSLDNSIKLLIKTLGTDAALVHDRSGNIYHASLIEKVLILFLAKISSFVPDGGIWLNTQRPEWNDANNALAGYGLSMVTLYYVRRFIYFWLNLWDKCTTEEIFLSQEIITYAEDIFMLLTQFSLHIENKFDPISRKAFMDRAGNAATAYYHIIYKQGGFSTKKKYPFQRIVSLFRIAALYLDKSIKTNKRTDGLYHAYNLLNFQKDKNEVSIKNLYIMLEGQVAVFSSGALSPKQSLDLYHNLAASSLFQPGRQSFLLYPDKNLPNFFEKNRPNPNKIKSNPLLFRMLSNKDHRIIEESRKGTYHFQADITNKNDLDIICQEIDKETTYGKLMEKHKDDLFKLYEETFLHQEFTGRSGGMFAYEGLGSIYWHMIAKLLLAMQENYMKAIEYNADPGVIQGLKQGYFDVRKGIGYLKDPAAYGAFPIDPYSHTPAHSGARQPGMTGQVKEEIITRFGELGIRINSGCFYFNPTLISSYEWIKENTIFHYYDVYDQKQSLEVKANQIAFTICQVPVVYERSKTKALRVILNNDKIIEYATCIDHETTQSVIRREGKVKLIFVLLGVE